VAWHCSYAPASLLLRLTLICLFAVAAAFRLFARQDYKDLNKNNKLASRIQYAAKF
jgi:hypothetical protein